MGEYIIIPLLVQTIDSSPSNSDYCLGSTTVRFGKRGSWSFLLSRVSGVFFSLASTLSCSFLHSVQAFQTSVELLSVLPLDCAVSCAFLSKWSSISNSIVGELFQRSIMRMVISINKHAFQGSNPLLLISRKQSATTHFKETTHTHSNNFFNDSVNGG